MRLKIEEARKELREKDEEQIETETAIKWASRAAVAYEMCLEHDERAIELFSWAEDMYHEALEHAGLSKDVSLVEEIKTELEKRREECLNKYQKKASRHWLSRRALHTVSSKDVFRSKKLLMRKD